VTAFALVFGVPANAMELREDSLHENTNPLPVIVISEPSLPGDIALRQEEVYMLIDSVLDLTEIPGALTVKIESFTDGKYSQPVMATCNNGYSTSQYPADKYYKSWDTFNTHPYKDLVSKNDSSLELVLENSDSFFVQPVIGPVTSYFGDKRNHNGIDIDLEVWDTVVTAFDGVVRIARYHGGYGRVVVVRHYNGLETLYAHLHRLKVEPGDKVKAGQLIGLGGSSGNSTGSHLHFECRFKGKPINAGSFIDFEAHQLINDTLVLKKTVWNYSALPKGVKYHKVVKGEFLYLIARKYGTSISAICSLNGISRNSILKVGQRLRIEG
jgi:LysM repeat protein